MRTPNARTAVLLIAAILLASPTRSEEQPFVGKWSLDPSNCGAGQESENAPLIIAKDRYDRHESHCTFKSVQPGDGEWKITSECSAEGSPTPYDFSLTVSGDTLTFTDSGGPRDFLRCKP